MEPRGGVLGIIAVVAITLILLLRFSTICPRVGSLRPSRGAIDPGPVCMARYPGGTDQRGAPVESPGHETLKRLEQKRSRGRSSPVPREAFHERKSKRGAKIDKPQINNGDSFDKTSDASKTRQMRKANEKAASGT